MIKSSIRLLFIFLMPVVSSSQAQDENNSTRKKLEDRRQELYGDISNIDNMLAKSRDNMESLVENIGEIDRKIKRYKELVVVMKQQIQSLDGEIEMNKKNIRLNENELSELKSDYAYMIHSAYKNRSKKSRMMFVLSSENFFQAYKRIEYIRQYSENLRLQGIVIKKKTEDIVSLNKNLKKRLKRQQSLKLENESIEKKLIDDKTELRINIDIARRKASDYKVIIEKKQREAKQIDKEIERLIREAINKSRKRVEKKTIEFEMTKEAVAISKKFYKKKRKLIWPVYEGVITQPYGYYHDPVYPSITYRNNGISIRCPKGEDVHAIFEGEVTGIIKIRSGQKAVQVRHGDYISTYYNLSEVYVKQGDTVYAKKKLGKIYTNPSTHKTELKFYIYKDLTVLNPQLWIRKYP